MSELSLPMLSHSVYFTLNEPTPENCAALIAGCDEFLTGHPGEVFYSAGRLNPDLARPVNDHDFDVCLHVVFQDFASQSAYQTAPRHEEFIAKHKEMWKQVRVFDADVHGRQG